MPNTENLIPFGELSKEEAEKIRKKGGKARGEQQRQEKSLRQCAKMLLSLKPTDEKARKIIKSAGIKSEYTTNAMLATLAIYNKALKGDVAAYRTLMEAEESTNAKDNTCDKAELPKLYEALRGVDEE